jgi:protein-S-isoprenylcysteine O-methyltransferase Ste14
MFGSIKIKAVILVPLFVFIVVSSFLVLSYSIIMIFGIALRIAFPLPIRLFGLSLIALSLGLFGWLFHYRKPIDIIVSTYVTLMKAIRKINLKNPVGRTESLTILGPHKYVRHLLYFCVFLLLLGCWLLLDYTFLFFGALFLFLWFKFIVIPFEERELVAIFGDQYKDYMKEDPSIIPFTKRHVNN